MMTKDSLESRILVEHENGNSTLFYKTEDFEAYTIVYQNEEYILTLWKTGEIGVQRV